MNISANRTGLFLQAGSVILLLLAWQLTAWLRPEWTFFIGSPGGVVQAVVEPEIAARLPYDTFITLYQALLGFALGTATGTVLGLSLWLSRTSYQIVRPYLVFLASIPIFALGPILIFWFGTDLASKVALVFIATFSVATIQAYQGALACDINLIRLGVAFGATKSKLFTKIIAPSAFVWTLGAAKINISLALVASVVGEMIASRRGLGNLLVTAEGLYDIDLMLACIFMISGLAIALNGAIYPLEKWASKGTSPVQQLEVPAHTS